MDDSKTILSEELAEAPVVPRRAGVRYVSGRQIARGGMGSIRLAEDQTLYRTVAMKVLVPPKAEKRPVSEARFIREAMVLARLEHPNIVPIHDFGELPDGSFFYTMKLVKG